MRGLSTVAAFVVFLLAFAVVMFSVFYFYNALREATQKGVEAIYSAVTHDTSVGISFNRKTCNLTGGPYLYYVVTNRTGHVVYNGSGPPPCPPARRGLYTYRAVRRDGGLDVAMVAVGNLSLSFSADRSNAVVNDYNRTAVYKIRALLVNPNGAYALLTNITATPAAAGFTCAPSVLRVDKPLLIPPGGSLALDMGAVACNATDTYLYVRGAPPVPLNVTGTAYYNGVVVANASQPVASVATVPPKPGNFTAYGGRCRVGYFSGDAPRYYVLLSGASPVARGPVATVDGGYAVVPCPASSGFFRYRVVTASGAVVEVPVSVGRVLAWAESNMTVAYVNGIGQTVYFDLYLRFTNPNAGYTALNFTYTLIYNTQLLKCYPNNGSGTLTLQPGETRAIYVATHRCDVQNKFNETNIAVNITATYTGGGYTATLYRGVVGKPSFAGAPSWVVLKILWGNGTAVAKPGYSAVQLIQRKSLVTLMWAPTRTCTLNFGWENGLAPPGVPYATIGQGSWAVDRDGIVKNSGSWSLRLTADGTRRIQFGVAALVWDIWALGVTTDAVIQVYNRLDYGGNRIDEINYVELLIRMANGSTVKVYFVKKIVDWNRRWLPSGLFDVIDIPAPVYVCNLRSCSPPPGHIVRDLGFASRGAFSKFFPDGFSVKGYLGIDGQILKIAFAVSDGQYAHGSAKSWWDDFSLSWC